MYRIIFVLLLFVNALFAHEKMLAQNEFLYFQISVVPVSSLLVDEMDVPLTNMFVVPEENSRQNRIYAAAFTSTGDH